MDRNIRITGDGNVVGSHNTVNTNIHKGLSGNELKDLGNAFVALKKEILSLDISDKLKNRAARAVEDAEDEASEKKPDDKSIIESLERAKDILESAGKTYDSAASWGKRLSELGKIILPFIPLVGTWILSLKSG